MLIGMLFGWGHVWDPACGENQMAKKGVAAVREIYIARI